MSEGSWTEAVMPIANRCKVATTFGSEVVFNLDGAAALAELLTNMAALLDAAGVSRRALDQVKEEGGGDA